MNCTHCGAGLAASASFCPQCGQRVGATPAPLTAQTAPLTREQRMYLEQSIRTIPRSGMLVMSVLFLTTSCFWAPSLDRTLGKLVAAAVVLVLIGMGVLIVLGVRAARADLHVGVAQVRVARLVAKRDNSRSSHNSRGGVKYSGTFEQAGIIHLSRELYEPLVIGQTYLVTYSPHTHRGWSAEPYADSRIDSEDS